jgi:hypothetical protein
MVKNEKDVGFLGWCSANARFSGGGQTNAVLKNPDFDPNEND